MRSFVTVFADASFCPDTKAAGWGAWFKTQGFESKIVGGRVRKKLSGSSEAEICGIVNAVWAADLLGYISQGSTIMVQCDCLRALRILLTRIPGTKNKGHAEGASITGATADISDLEKECAEFIRKVLSAKSATLFVRHVKGHRSGDGRQWVNRQCDAVAKAHMRQRRAEILAEGSKAPEIGKGEVA